MVCKEKMPEIISRIGCPQLSLPAGNDKAAFKEGGQVEQLLSGKAFASDCVFRTFPSMKHGFVSRGDVRDPDVQAAVDEALELLRNFFRVHLRDSTRESMSM